MTVPPNALPAGTSLEFQRMAVNTISADELAVYDRQIRVWGFETQQRMRNSSVCLVSMTGLAAEVAKNITLAGIGSIHLVDHVVVLADDEGGANFLQSGAGASRAHASIARLSALNPNVRITVESAVITDKDAAFFAQFNVVCVFGAPLSVQIRVDELCRAASSPQRTPVFFSADALGLAAYFTADFQKHQAIITTKEEGKEEDTTSVQHFDFVSTADLFHTSFAQIQKLNGRRMASVSQLWISILILLRHQHAHPDTPQDVDNLQAFKAATLAAENVDAGAIPDDIFQLVANGWGHEISPVCAVVGGLLAQEVLKAVSGKDAPLQNVVLFNGIMSEAGVQNLRP